MRKTSPAFLLAHAQYAFEDTLPESKEAFGEIASVFAAHLGKQLGASALRC